MHFAGTVRHRSSNLITSLVKACLSSSHRTHRRPGLCSMFTSTWLIYPHCSRLVVALLTILLAFPPQTSSFRFEFQFKVFILHSLSPSTLCFQYKHPTTTTSSSSSSSFCCCCCFYEFGKQYLSILLLAGEYILYANSFIRARVYLCVVCMCAGVELFKFNITKALKE